ncbi:MAG: hypothetical protein H7Z40_19960 [Phycisphaerae bacterium]|nr:hypothetical protein [Gemmatimonadaceae bacterium]
MFRISSRRMRVLGVALFAAIATPLNAGPPWISIELPGNPFDQQARDAFLVVHAFHHGEAVDFPVAGTAEGVVNGVRKSIPLTFQKTSRAGAFGVKKQWTDGTVWVLAFTVTQAKNDVASALVTIGADGHASRIETLTKPGEGGRLFPRGHARRDIDAAMQAATTTASR